MARERVAVVFIHGQGQQSPMDDVLDLAKSVWRADVNAGARPQPLGADDVLAPVYSVPIFDHQASDQRRVITRDAAIPGTKDTIQVDFYQFYWADLMSGNRFTQLWKWFINLIKKDPKVDIVPPPIVPLRRLTFGVAYGLSLWSMTLAATVIACLIGPGFGWSALDAAIWGGALATACAIAVVIGLLRYRDRRIGHGPEPELAPRALDGLLPFLELLGTALPMLMIGLGLAFQVFDEHIPPADAVAMVLGGLMLLIVILSRFREQLLWTFILAVVLLIACCAIGPFATVLQPRPLLSNLPVEDLRRYALGATLVPAVGLGGIIWMLYRSFLLPVMTESARLFTPSPDNVPNQDKIRERGLKLLEELHGPKIGYDRIVVLAHSLGTAVGYGLLTYYWGKVNEQLAHSRTKAQRDKVEAAAGALLARSPAPGTFMAFRQAVRAYGAALARPVAGPKKAGGKAAKTTPSPWRISDFITIGSPLTYAAFLLGKSDADFWDQVMTYRRFAMCPPQPLDLLSRYGFTLNGAPHHAAPFAATCWTNLYFPDRGLVWGDIISGPIAGDFHFPEPHGNSMKIRMEPPRLGRGILDVALDHPALRSFSHNDYWPWPEKARVANPPPHIEALRHAFHFFTAPATADAALCATPPPPFAGWP